MNISVYAFGQFEMGYSQYPDDYTGDIFTEFYKHSKAKTQIAIHRDGSLMYYAYIRKLEQDRYIGLCAVLNSQMLTRIDSLFGMFENVFTGMVAKGQIIQFNEQGDIVTRTSMLHMEKADIDELTAVISANFDRLETTSLPPIDYSVANDSTMDYTINDNATDIIYSTAKNGFTYIYKSEGYDTAELKTYQGKLNRLNQSNNELKQKNDAITAELKTYQGNLNRLNQANNVLRQKNDAIQERYNDLQEKQQSLYDTNNQLNKTNQTLNSQKENLTRENSELSQEKNELQARNNELERKLAEAQRQQQVVRYQQPQYQPQKKSNNGCGTAVGIALGTVGVYLLITILSMF